MKRIFIYVLAAAAALVFSVSCKSPEVTEPGSGQKGTIDEQKVAAFVEMADYGVYGEDVSAVFVFDKKQHELIWNTKVSRFIIQDDAQKALLTVTLTPSGEESHYNVSVTSQEEGLTGTYTMKMVKAEGEAAWLWDVENKLGVVVLQ